MRTLFAAAIFALTSTAPALADVVATQTVEREVLVKLSNGAVRTERKPADKVTPGETVVYTLSYENKGEAPVDDLVLVMPVPRDVSFVEGSASGDGAVSFSADDGETYVARGRLTVQENGQTRAARGDEITHVRWTLGAPALPGAKGSVSFKAVLR